VRCGAAATQFAHRVQPAAARRVRREDAAVAVAQRPQGAAEAAARYSVPPGLDLESRLARRDAAEAEPRHLRAVDSRRQAAPEAAAQLPFRAGHGARIARALHLAQPVASARRAAELLPEEPDAAPARRQEAPAVPDVPAAVVVAGRRPEAVPDGVAAAGPQPEAAPDGVAAAVRQPEAAPDGVAAAVRQPEAAPAAAAAEAVVQRAAEPADAVGLPPVAEAVRDAAGRRQEEVPLAAVWASRRDRFPPGARPARQPKAHPRSAPARRGLRDAQRSAPWWRAAQNETLS
jgi:hypothetical protein